MKAKIVEIINNNTGKNKMAVGTLNNLTIGSKGHWSGFFKTQYV